VEPALRRLETLEDPVDSATRIEVLVTPLF